MQARTRIIWGFRSAASRLSEAGSKAEWPNTCHIKVPAKLDKHFATNKGTRRIHAVGPEHLLFCSGNNCAAGLYAIRLWLQDQTPRKWRTR